MSTEFTTMMSFSFTTQTPEIRTMLDRDGESWFVLNDVCEVLGIINPRSAACRLGDFEKSLCKIGTSRGMQEMNIINESGLFNLIFRSDKPHAEAFRKWVTSEVLPAIRKEGFYGGTGFITIPNDPAQAYALWAHLDRQLHHHKCRAKVLRRNIKSCLRIMQQHSTPIGAIESLEKMLQDTDSISGVLS